MSKHVKRSRLSWHGMCRFPLMDFTIQKSVSIQAQPSEVWEALNDREMIFRCFLGGVKDDDPSVASVIKKLPPKFLHTLNLHDTAENQSSPNHIIYILEAQDELTRLEVIHEDIESEDSYKFLDSAWSNLLNGMKRKLERA